MKFTDLQMFEPEQGSPAHATGRLAVMVSIYRCPDFWRGALATRVLLAGTEPENHRRHEEAVSDLAALELAAGGGEDLTTLPAFHRWLSQDTATNTIR
jgi:hypothetical protein